MRKHFILNINVKGFKKFYVIFTPEKPVFTVQDFRENPVIDTRVPHVVETETQGWSNSENLWAGYLRRNVTFPINFVKMC